MAREFSKTIYDIGQRIRQVRLEKDMSQTDLALAMDTSRNVISRWETGENAIRLDSLLRLSEELQVSPVSLIRTNVDDASEEELLFGQIQELEPAQKAFMLQAMRTMIRGLQKECGA